MISLSRLRAGILVAALAIALGAQQDAVAQQGYPSRPITLVLPFAAGTGTDTTTRIIAKHLSTDLGQPIVIENKSGATGSIAASQVAHAAPDGYTLLVGTSTTHSGNPSLLKIASYDPVKDFTPIARTGNLPFLLVVNPELPAKSVRELIVLAKKQPGSLTYATGSATSIVAGAMLARRAGIDVLGISYRGSTQAVADLLANRISMIFLDIATSMPMINAGSLRALGVTTRERAPLAPEIPTMEEAGVPNFDLASWQGYFGPAGLPSSIVARLNASLRKIVERPDVKAQLAQVGMDVVSSTPEQLGELVHEQRAAWAQLIKDAGIEPQ